MKNKSISFFFPVYNEAPEIKNLVSQTKSALEEITNDYEIIIVNDGSTDETGKIAEGLAKANSHIKVINHKKNLGHGIALKTGYSNVSKEIVLYMDGDNQFDVREMVKFIPMLEEADIVSGYRSKRADSLGRIFTSWIYNTAIRLCLGLKLKDVDCGFKLYKRKTFGNIQLKCNSPLVIAEILIKAKKNGFAIKQIPVHHYPRKTGSSSVNLKVAWKTLVELIKFWKELR